MVSPAPPSNSTLSETGRRAVDLADVVRKHVHPKTLGASGIGALHEFKLIQDYCVRN